MNTCGPMKARFNEIFPHQANRHSKVKKASFFVFYIWKKGLIISSSSSNTELESLLRRASTSHFCVASACIQYGLQLDQGRRKRSRAAQRDHLCAQRDLCARSTHDAHVRSTTYLYGSDPVRACLLISIGPPSASKTVVRC